MFSFTKNKDLIIAKLRAENLRLSDEIKKWQVISRYDIAVDKVVYFPNTDKFIDYLKLKAENNIRMSNYIGFYSETITPKELDLELLNIKRQLRLFECQLGASLEKSFMCVDRDKQGEG